MSCKSLLYAVNAGTQAVAANGGVQFSTLTRRYGCDCRLVGTNVVLTGAGYYDVGFNVTALPTAAGAITATLLVNGVAYPGATVTATAAAANEAVQLSLSPVTVRTCCCPQTSTLTVQLSAAAAVTNAGINVERV